MTKDEKEILSRIEKKLDEHIEYIIRHDEKIKAVEKTQKVLIGVSISIFLLTIGQLIARIMA